MRYYEKLQHGCYLFRNGKDYSLIRKDKYGYLISKIFDLRNLSTIYFNPAAEYELRELEESNLVYTFTIDIREENLMELIPEEFL